MGLRMNSLATPIAGERTLPTPAELTRTAFVAGRSANPLPAAAEKFAAVTQTRGHGGGLTVTIAEGLASFERFASEIDRLNLASARPNPFNSFAFLRSYALRSEYCRPGRGERLYLIRESGQTIGIAPMRRAMRDIGGLGLRLPSVCLEFLAPLDTEQPGILSAPENAERVAAALIHHFCEHEQDWNMLEFAGQRPDSALRGAVLAATGGKFRAREIPVDPYHEIEFSGKDLDAYFRSLSKKMRSNISRQARRLFAMHQPELILAQGAPAVTAWFDAYCDLDQRSWKSGTASSISRDARRIRFYREIATGAAGLEPGFIGVILDGVLIAGMLTGSNAFASPANHSEWCLEIAYDRSQAELGPGHLVLLAAVGRSIADGHRTINFMHKFGYYKHRWSAMPIEISKLQLIRRVSLRNARAVLGDWKRNRMARRNLPTEIGAAANDDDDSVQRAARPLEKADLMRARETTAQALAFSGPGVRRLDRGAASRLLPFSLG
jgi:hypothetical protein